MVLPESGGGRAPGQAPEFTRFIATFPGGPLLYADADGRVDVDFRDSYGRPWFLYRLREGRHTLYAALPAGQLRPPPGGDPDKDPLTPLRGTGLLTGGGWPAWPYLEYAPWYQGALEPDVLMGRRGVLGWDGHDYDPGTIIDWVAHVPTLLENLGDWWDTLPWWGKTLAATGAFVATVLGAWVLEIPMSLALILAGTAAVAGGSALRYGAEALLASGLVEENVGWDIMHVGGALFQMAGMVMAFGPAFGALSKAHPLAMLALDIGAGTGFITGEAMAAAEWDRSQSWHAWARRWGPDAVLLGAAAGYGAYRWALPPVAAGARALRIGLGRWAEESGLILRPQRPPGPVQVRFVGDSNVFMDRVEGGAVVRSLLDEVIADPRVRVVLPSLIRAELEIKPSPSQLARLRVAAGRLDEVATDVSAILANYPEIVGGNFGRADLQLVVTALAMRLPVVTAQSALARQVASSMPLIRTKLLGTVRILMPMKDFRTPEELVAILRSMPE